MTTTTNIFIGFRPTYDIDKGAGMVLVVVDLDDMVCRGTNADGAKAEAEPTRAKIADAVNLMMMILFGGCFDKKTKLNPESSRNQEYDTKDPPQISTSTPQNLFESPQDSDQTSEMICFHVANWTTQNRNKKESSFSP